MEEEEAVNSSLKRTPPPLGPKASILGAKFDGDFKLKWKIILRTQLSVQMVVILVVGIMTMFLGMLNDII